MVSQPVCLGVGSPCEVHDQIFTCYAEPFLTRERVCNLLIQFAVTLRSKSRRTHDHILLSHLRLLGSISVASYDSQGYSGSILTCLHMPIFRQLSKG
jgi:hypothetical protein